MKIDNKAYKDGIFQVVSNYGGEKNIDELYNEYDVYSEFQDLDSIDNVSSIMVLEALRTSRWGLLSELDHNTKGEIIPTREVFKRDKAMYKDNVVDEYYSNYRVADKLREKKEVYYVGFYESYYDDLMLIKFYNLDKANKSYEKLNKDWPEVTLYQVVKQSEDYQ